MGKEPIFYLFVVGEAGIEPARHKRQILSLVCLPIPPLSLNSLFNYSTKQILTQCHNIVKYYFQQLTNLRLQILLEFYQTLESAYHPHLQLRQVQH